LLEPIQVGDFAEGGFGLLIGLAEAAFTEPKQKLLHFFAAAQVPFSRSQEVSWLDARADRYRD
jgi:hypothetical protein